MEPERRYALIGAVLLTLMVAAVLAFVWLANSGRSADYRFYTIYFQRQSLEGLQIGGDVTMRGVKVGRVEDYTISRDNINRVAVTVRVARHTPVSENTKAVVARNILTGIARITLETPGTPGPELTHVIDGERFPIIPEGTSNIDQIADAATRLAIGADQALGQLNNLLGPHNQQSVSEGLDAFRNLARGLDQRTAHLDATTQSIREAARSVAQASQGISRIAEQLTTQVAPLGNDLHRVLQETRTTLQTLQQTSEALHAEVSRTLQQWQSDGRQLSQTVDNTLDLSLHELRATAEEVRGSADRLNRTLDRLHDPKAALLGPSSAQLGPGEERR
jgi:phospholipid/cholesterol/gamma-HCH transport system substrate-binding protein